MKGMHKKKNESENKLVNLPLWLGWEFTDLAQQVTFNLSAKDESQICKFQSEESLDSLN